MILANPLLFFDEYRDLYKACVRDPELTEFVERQLAGMVDNTEKFRERLFNFRDWWKKLTT